MGSLLYSRKSVPISNIPMFVGSKTIKSHLLFRRGELSAVVGQTHWLRYSSKRLLERLYYTIFSFEYFQDDLIVVLVNSISDVSSINKAIHGFNNDGIPEAKDVVRIDVVGGFALQKVNNERSYLRAIANMDTKLDFVPPSLTNFTARQLVGNGFRVFQKTVASVSNNDEDYCKALGDPLFVLTREALNSVKRSREVLEGQELKSEACLLPNANLIEGTEDDMHDIEHKIHANDHAGESPLKKAQDTKRKAFGEIEEEESKESTCLEEGVETANQPSTRIFAYINGVNAIKRISIHPALEEALGTLEKAIAIAQQYGFNAQSRSSSFPDEKTLYLEENAVKNSTDAVEDNVCLKVENGLQAASIKFEENLEMASDDSGNSIDINATRYAGSNSASRGVNHNKVVPAASPQQNVSLLPTETNQVALNSHGNGTIKANGFHENGVKDVKRLSNWRRQRICCFFGFHSR
ncbi:hypothetical protein DITRI_Ditri06bG0033300 [Diplodiscus trichospermus]